MSDPQRDNELNFEKWALALFAAFIMAMMSWIALSVSENQVQYAVIKTNQLNIKSNLLEQTAILMAMQSKFNDSNIWRAKVDSQLSVLKEEVENLKE